jgi:branched-chain amino acid transport system substrate-binding protein
MRRRLGAGTLAAGLVLGLVPATAGELVTVRTATAASPSGTPIVVGSIETQTTPGQTAKTTTVRDTLRAWANWENARGGIAGHPVEVVVLDDHGDVTQAASALRELVERRHAVAIVGNNAPATESSWKDYVESVGVPVIGGSEYSTNWLTSPYFYPVSTTVLSNVWGELYAGKNAGNTKYASLLCSNLSICQGASLVIGLAARSLGVDVVYEGTADANAASYDVQCRAMQSSGADFVGPQGIDVVALVRDCSRAGYAPLVVVPNLPYSLQQLQADKELDGIAGPTPSIDPYATYSVTKDRDTAIKKYAPAYASGGKNYRTVPLLALSNAWEAALAFAKAVEDAAIPASQPVTAADVRAGLAKFDHETLGGSNPPLTYGDGSAPNPEVKCFYLYTVRNKKYVDQVGADGLPALACEPPES